jgi:hypothetical protein
VARRFAMPSGDKAAQDEVLRHILLQQAHGCVAHMRVLAVRDAGTWIGVGGRIDVARPDDRPLIKARPIGGARLLEETLTLEALVERLAVAFRGEPFVVARQPLAGHGMDSHWLAERYTDTWGDYGVRWPIIEFAPTKFPTPQVYLYDAYEAEGKAEALDGILDCVRFALGYVGVDSQSDVRGKRFAICVWDYRGVFRQKSDRRQLFLQSSDNYFCRVGAGGWSATATTGRSLGLG